MRPSSRRVAIPAGIAVTLAALSLRWLVAAPYDRPTPALPAPSVAVEAVRRAVPEARAATPMAGADPGSASVAQTPEKPPEAHATRTPPLAGTRNVLVVGRDRRPDGGGAALADTILVVVIDERSGHVGLVSVPRDLYVDIPDHGFDKINAVYSVAARQKRKALEVLAGVLRDTLALPVEHALALDLGVFERAVDVVGGVDVRVPCPLADSFLDSRVDGGRRRLDVPSGTVHMDGVTAAMYVRSRHGRSDWDRARRQQAVLLGLRERLSGASGAALLPGLWAAFEDSLETDLRRIDVLRLAERALSTDPRHLHGLVIGHAHTDGTRTAEGRSVLVPKPDAIHRALSELFSAPSPGTPLPASRCAARDAALGGS
jgi:LCP family protein required for cell wall assembly